GQAACLVKSFLHLACPIMPACSFNDGKFMTQHVNLNLANEHLQWNPYPLDRDERQEVLWNRRSESPTQPLEKEQRLRLALNAAEYWAQHLAKHHTGRVILAAEEPGRNALEPQYWLARVRFYKAEYERLEEDDYNRASRSMTPAFYQPESLDETELDCVKRQARSAAENLARFPAGKAMLDAEDHGEFGTDPEYWRRKKKEYWAAYAAIPKESALERAKRHAYTNRKSWPHSLRVWLWWKLKIMELLRWTLNIGERGGNTTGTSIRGFGKTIHFDWILSPEPSNYSTTPSEASIASTPKTRPRRSSMTKRRPTTRSIRTIRSTPQHRKETNGIQVAIDEMKGARSTGRRKSKGAYRRQRAQVVKTKPQRLLPEHSLPQSPPNGLATPSTGDSRSRRPAAQNDWDRPARSTGHKPVIQPPGARSKSYLQSQDAYDTPDSPEEPKTRARERHRRKATTRLKRLQDRDGTYHESRSVSQPVDPISSRLRSSGHRLHKGAH
ncbi:MAG: hypothetical protein Q9217_006207, partial [Psora testacea]